MILMSLRRPYFPEDATHELEKLDLLITVGINKLPVANFGYESALISELVTHLDLDHAVWEVGSPKPYPIT